MAILGEQPHDGHVRLVFSPADGGRCRTVIRRHDGVTMEMRSYSRRHRVPHDLAHAVTERELQLRAGVFGCVAAGAVFSSMRVLTGSPRHDAAARSARIIKANNRSIALAEVLSGVLHHAVEGPSSESLYDQAREGWEIMEERPFPYTAATLAAAAEALKAVADRWNALAPDEQLAFTWPQSLTAPIPTTRR